MSFWSWKQAPVNLPITFLKGQPIIAQKEVSETEN